jgi:glycosyltransferase involved in cell wall biosynthesis
MPPQTILYLTPSSRLFGARRSLLQLVTHLDPERYRPVVVAQTEGDLVDTLRDAGIETRILFLGWWRKGRYMLTRPWAISRLARLARTENAGLIHCNEFFPNPYAVRAAAKADSIPVVTHMRLTITPRRVRNYDLRRAARVLCVSEAAARDFDLWPDRHDRVEVVYNGVDLDAFRPPPDPAQAKQAFGLAAEDFVIGQFGLIGPRKQTHLLIEATERLHGDLPRLRVLIVGDARRGDEAYEQQMRTMVDQKGLADVVRFVPFQQNVVPAYQACDVNALVSNQEGFGRTIIEAGAMGIPSVGTRVGGIPELIIEGETGRLIENDAAAAKSLADCLRRFATKPDDLARLGKSVRKHVEKHFSIRAHADHVMSIYDQVLAAATPDGKTP